MASRGHTKDELRSRLLAARRARSASDLARLRTLVRAHALDLAQALECSCVAAYEPLRTEPGSVELLAELQARGMQVLVPHTRTDNDLDWREWPDGDALLGVDAVAAAHLVFVPALAVAVDGTRLGRGGGSYDRALGRRQPGAQVWALLFDDELVDGLPSEAWDVPVNGVVRPTGPLPLPGNTGTATRSRQP